MPGSSSPSSPNESLGRNAPMLGRLPGLLTLYDDTRDHIQVRDDLQNEEISIAIVTIIRLVYCRIITTIISSYDHYSQGKLHCFDGFCPLFWVASTGGKDKRATVKGAAPT